MKMHSIECCAFSVAELVRSLGSISTSDPYQPFMKGPLMAERSPSKTTKLSNLNDRYREKLTFKIEAGNIINPAPGERPLYPRKRTLS